MVSKITICCLIVITLLTLSCGGRMNKRQQKRIANLQKSLMVTNEKILKAIPRRMSPKQKKSAKHLLEKHVKNWNRSKADLKRGIERKISRRQLKALDSEFDATVKAVQRLLHSKSNKRFTLDPLSIVTSAVETFEKGVRKLVNILKEIGEKVAERLLKWLKSCTNSSTSFLKGLKNAFKSDGSDATDEDVTPGGGEDDTPGGGEDDTPGGGDDDPAEEPAEAEADE